MIILCARCHARFRVADEKIGPRGAKVRCSKCGNVFPVYRDPSASTAAPAAPAKPPPPPAPSVVTTPPAPSFDIELESGASRGRAATPPPLPIPPIAPPTPSLADDPFAAVREPAGEPLAHGGPFADPFAVAAAAPASAPLPAPGLPEPAFDPGAVFAEAALGDPFVATVTPRTPPAAPAQTSLPVTDLSALLGPSPSAAPSPASPETHPAASTDVPLELDLGGSAARPAADPSPGYGELPGFGMAPPLSGHDEGLALDIPPRGEAGHDAWGTAEASLTAEPLAAAVPSPRHGVAPAPPDAPVPGFRGPAAGPAVAADELPSRAPAAAGEPERAAGAEPRAQPADLPVAAPQTAAPRRSPLRSVALNAVSLAALLLVVLALVAVWRGGGSPSAALRNVTALAGLGDAVAVEVPFPTRDVSSGLFDRADGPPVLYVRGTVESRAPAAVPGVRVAVDILRAGSVVARGEALAGAVPTPEELYEVGDAEDLARCAGEWTLRAPARVEPGATLPFLVAIVDVPADLTGTTVRVTASAAEPER